MINDKIIGYIKNKYKQKEFLDNPTGYFYDLRMISDNLQLLKESLPNEVNLYYAMKANADADVMDWIIRDEYVKGIEIASYGEMKKAQSHLSLLHPQKEMLFTGPGKTPFELEQAILSEMRYINVESMTEAIRINNMMLGSKEFVENSSTSHIVL